MNRCLILFSLLWFLGITSHGVVPLTAQDPGGGGLLDQLEQDGLGAGGFGDSIFGSDDPISWKLKPVSGAVPGEITTLKLQATMERGWHIYGLDQDPEWGVATSITVLELQDFQLEGDISEPEPHEREVGDEYYLEHEGETVFEIPIRVPAEATPGARSVSVSVTYQACDAKECLLPKTLVMSADIRVGSAALKGTEVSGGATETATFQADESPVKWTVPVVEPLKPDSTFQVVVSAEIERGWHIYGVDMNPENGTPTRFSSADESILKVVEVKELTPPYSGFDPLIGANSSKHQRQARFEVTLSYEGDSLRDSGTLPLVVESMSCDAMMCLPEERLGLDIPVGNAANSEAVDPPSVTEVSDPRVASYSDADLQLTATLKAGDTVQSGDLVTLQIEGKVSAGNRIPAFRKDIQAEYQSTN